MLCVPVSAFAAFGFLDRWGTDGTAAGQMRDPQGVGVGPNGHVYVVEFSGFRVNEFTSTGGFVRMWGKDVGGSGVNSCTSGCSAAIQAAGDGEFGFGGDLDVHPVNGDVYVIDDTDRLQQFTSTGTFIRKWGGGGGQEGNFDDSLGLDVTANAVFVADAGNDRIQQFTLDGTFERMWGKDVGGPGVNLCTSGCQTGVSGNAAGEFNNPLDVGAAPSGDLYVTDANTNRVQQFSPAATFLRTWGKNVGGPGVNVCTSGCVAGASGSGDGEFDNPAGIAFDGAGNVWVSEGNSHRVQEFDGNGSFLAKFGSPGAGATGFDVPIGINFDCRGNLYVADFDNDRVQKLGEPGAGEPPCVATSPPSPPSPSPSPAPVTSQIQSLALGSKTFKAVNAGGSIFSKAKPRVAIGTSVSYRLSAAATATFSVERATKGRKAGKKCRKQTRKNRQRKRCTRFKAVKGGFAHAGAAGPNRFKFSGRIRSKALKPSRYRLVARAGPTVRRASFRIVR